MEFVRLEDLCLPPPLPGGAPWLVYQHNPKKLQTFSTIWPENKFYLKAIPELEDKFVRTSCYGWLLLQHSLYFLNFYLWNPMTLETIYLPLLENLLDLDDDVRISTCALTSSPDDDDDFAVFVFCDYFAFSCRPRSDHDPRWRVDEIEIEGEQASISDAIACNRVIYACASYSVGDEDAYKHSLITLEANVDGDHDDKFSSSLLLDVPDRIHPKCNGYQTYLLESNSQVYYVCLAVSNDPRIDAVEIWELNLDKKEWVEVKSLNDRAFFLGRDSCTWCWASTEVEANSVFLLRALNLDDGLDSTLGQYRLEDHSLTVYLPCPKLLSPRTRPFWFIPEQPRSLAKPLQKPSIDEVDILNQNADVDDSKELSKQNETTGNMLNGLPLDIIALVSRHLHLFDYLSFRTTCKSYRSTLPLSLFRRRTYDASLPLFVFLKSKEGLFQVMDPIRNDSVSIAIPKPPKGAFCIQYCKDGWLVLYSGGETLHFFNLFTRKRGDFPPNEYTRFFKSVGFSTYPGSSDCVTVGIYGHKAATIWYFVFGDQTWESAEFDSGQEEFFPSTCPPVYHNGGFYFLDRKGSLGVFKLVGRKATWHVYGRPQIKQMQFLSFYLVECDGRLFCVIMEKLGIQIKVFSFDDQKKDWVRVKSLGNHTFFISRSSSISTVARELGSGNRIYFPRLHDNRFIFYSLETRKYHGLGTEFYMENFCPSQEPLDCSWA